MCEYILFCLFAKYKCFNYNWIILYTHFLICFPFYPTIGRLCVQVKEHISTIPLFFNRNIVFCYTDNHHVFKYSLIMGNNSDSQFCFVFHCNAWGWIFAYLRNFWIKDCVNFLKTLIYRAQNIALDSHSPPVKCHLTGQGRPRLNIDSEHVHERVCRWDVWVSDSVKLMAPRNVGGQRPRHWGPERSTM